MKLHAPTFLMKKYFTKLTKAKFKLKNLFFNLAQKVSLFCYNKTKTEMNEKKPKYILHFRLY